MISTKVDSPTLLRYGTLNTLSDEDLILRIMKDRDRDAFLSLYERYKKEAYNLSRFMTRSQDLAEEAVQDAMLEIWNNSSFRRQSNSARGWVMTVVMRCSLKLLRKRGRVNRREQAVAQRAAEIPVEPDVALEREEVLAHLRTRLDKLSEQDRQIVALYFGGRTSQDEIASSLHLPQTTVSYRIQKIMETLRGELSKAGFAGVGIESVGELLSSAVLKGSAVPAGLDQSVMEALQRSALDFSDGNAADPKGMGIGVRFLVAGVAIIGVLAVIGFAGQRPMDQVKTEKMEPHEDVEKQPYTIPASMVDVLQKIVPRDLPCKWNFDAGIPSDLIKLGGSWNAIEKSKLGLSGALSVPDYAYLLLPLDLDQDLVVSFEAYHFTDKKRYTHEHFFAIVPFSSSDGMVKKLLHQGRTFRPMNYLFDGQTHQFEIHVEASTLNTVFAVDGLPVHRTLLGSGVAASRKEGTLRLAIFLRTLQLDNLYVRRMSLKDRVMMKEVYRAGYDLIWDFDLKQFPSRMGLKKQFLRTPHGGPDGSGSLTLNGERQKPAALFLEPFNVGLKSGNTDIMQEISFDYCPLEGGATTIQMINIASYNPDQLNFERFVEQSNSNETPRQPKVTDALKKKAAVSLLKLNRWYRVTLVVKPHTTDVQVKALHRGEARAKSGDGDEGASVMARLLRKNVVSSNKLRFIGLWFHARCRLDNLNMRALDVESAEVTVSKDFGK